MVLLLLDAGLRNSELVNLNVDDLDLAGGKARVLHGKGKKQRVVAFSGTVAVAIEAYLDLRGDRSGVLFQSRLGGRLKTTGVITLFDKLSKATGLPKVHAHRFRHTFATMAIRSAAREIDVHHLLGHTTSAMVRRYTRTYDAEQAALAHASFSPVASLHLEPGPASVPARVPVPAPSRSGAMPVKATRTVALRDRKLVPGMRLRASYKGVVYEACVIEDDDGIGIRPDGGPIFASLSAAGDTS